MQTSLTSTAYARAGDRPRIDQKVIERPLRHVQLAGKAYPGLWKQMDDLRHRRGEVGGWPNWCFLPLAGAREAALAIGIDLDAFGSVIVGALASWRTTQGIYLFDRTIFDELWITPLEGTIPIEVLEGLPEWCCYIAFPEPRQFSGIDVQGFFVQLQYDLESHQRDLHIVFDMMRASGDQFLAPTVLRLVGNLADCVSASLEKMKKSIENDDGRSLGLKSRGDALAFLERSSASNRLEYLTPILSLILYLASTTREISHPDGRPPMRPQAKPTRRDKTPRVFPPDRPRIWECGYRLGATLRAGMAAAETQRAHAERGPHASPRPHMRRAHWHCYWTGPLKGERKIRAKWLHPILVGGGDAGEEGLIPTVHRVAEPRYSAAARRPI